MNIYTSELGLGLFVFAMLIIAGMLITMSILSDDKQGHTALAVEPEVLDEFRN